MKDCPDRNVAGRYLGETTYTCGKADAVLGWRNMFQQSVCERCEAGNADAPMEAARAAIRHAIRDTRRPDAYRRNYKGDRASVVRRGLKCGLTREDICYQLAEAVGGGLDANEAPLIANSEALLEDAQRPDQ